MTPTASREEIQEHFNQLLNQVAAETPVDVLYLDDDLQVAENLTEIYEGTPVRLSLAHTPDEADRLVRERRPAVVITDQRLGEGVPDGAQWIQQYLGALKDTEFFILTAYAGDLKDPEALRRVGVHVISKGEVEEDELWQRIRALPLKRAALRLQTTFGEFAQAGEAAVAGWPGSIPPPGLSAPLNERFVRVFERWVDKFQNPEAERVLLADSVYSLLDLKDEVLRGSDIGDYFLDLFVQDIEALLDEG